MHHAHAPGFEPRAPAAPLQHAAHFPPAAVPLPMDARASGAGGRIRYSDASFLYPQMHQHAMLGVHDPHQRHPFEYDFHAPQQQGPAAAAAAAAAVAAAAATGGGAYVVQQQVAAGAHQVRLQPLKSCDLSTEQIEELITRRIHARRARSFQLADELLWELRENGVEVWDSPHNVWVACDGRRGPIDVNIAPAAGPCNLNTEYIQSIIRERAVQRRARNFRDADRLKEFLLSRGVVVSDRQNLWMASDGRRGEIE